jgi:hypothetical protein
MGLWLKFSWEWAYAMIFGTPSSTFAMASVFVYCHNFCHEEARLHEDKKLVIIFGNIVNAVARCNRAT